MSAGIETEQINKITVLYDNFSIVFPEVAGEKNKKALGIPRVKNVKRSQNNKIRPVTCQRARRVVKNYWEKNIFFRKPFVNNCLPRNRKSPSYVNYASYTIPITIIIIILVIIVIILYSTPCTASGNADVRVAVMQLYTSLRTARRTANCIIDVFGRVLIIFHGRELCTRTITSIRYHNTRYACTRGVYSHNPTVNYYNDMRDLSAKKLASRFLHRVRKPIFSRERDPISVKGLLTFPKRSKHYPLLHAITFAFYYVYE